MRSRAGKAALAALLLALASSAAADELYRAYANVTGQREETRRPAMPLAFRDVVVRVSGDPRLLDRPDLDRLYRDDLVTHYSYRDLMAHLPKRDEQGTRDRPHELTVDFVPQKIDAALAKLGARPWTAQRPKIAVFLSVELGPTRFVLADEGEPGGIQRTALLAAFRKYGLPVAVPPRAALDAAGITVDALKDPDLARLDAEARKLGADRALAASLVFSEAELGWIAHWRLADSGATRRWSIRGEKFDEAFRHAVRGTLQIVSGNGAPR